jgi:hypothetical protein
VLTGLAELPEGIGPWAHRQFHSCGSAHTSVKEPDPSLVGELVDRAAQSEDTTTSPAPSRSRYPPRYAFR